MGRYSEKISRRNIARLHRSPGDLTVAVPSSDFRLDSTKRHFIVQEPEPGHVLVSLDVNHLAEMRAALVLLDAMRENLETIDDIGSADEFEGFAATLKFAADCHKALAVSDDKFGTINRCTELVTDIEMSGKVAPWFQAVIDSETENKPRNLLKAMGIRKNTFVGLVASAVAARMAMGAPSQKSAAKSVVDDLRKLGIDIPPGQRGRGSPTARILHWFKVLHVAPSSGLGQKYPGTDSSAVKQWRIYQRKLVGASLLDDHQRRGIYEAILKRIEWGGKVDFKDAEGA